MKSMQWQLGMLGTISAFAYRHRETKKNLCRGDRSQDLPSTDFQPAVTSSRGLNEIGWNYAQWRAGCCESKPNEHFCSLDCWWIYGLSSKAGFWYLELILFIVVSFSLVYLIGCLLSYSVCLFVSKLVTYRYILYKGKGEETMKRRRDERERSVTENQAIIMRKFFFLSRE